MVLFDNATFDKLLAEAGKQKVVTPATLSERFRVCFFFNFHFATFELLIFLGELSCSIYACFGAGSIVHTYI